MIITFEEDLITGQYGDEVTLPDTVESMWVPDSVKLFDKVWDEEAEAEEIVFRPLSQVLSSLTLVEFKALYYAKMESTLHELEDKMIGQYSTLERLSLDAKYNEALYFQTNNELPAASIIGTEAQLLSMPVADLVVGIIAKGSAFRTLLGAVSAFRAMSLNVLESDDKTTIEAGLAALLEQATPYLEVEL